jgi:hypothetical protein
MSPNTVGEVDGGCTCRAVRFRVRGRPMFVHCCHCSWCQRETGTAFVLNAIFESDRVALIAGAPRLAQIPSASGKGQTVARCPQCQVALWSHYAGGGSAVSFVRVGTLDHPELFPPDIHIFTRTKLPWVLLPPDVPAVPEYYKLAERWPAESLARRQALREQSAAPR